MSKPRPWLTPAVRHGIPAAFLVVGILVVLLDSDSNVAAIAFAGFAGAALALWLIGALVRIGNVGDRERDHEEDARRYLDEHGHWPDEKPRR